MKTNEQINEIQNNLKQFTGTECYYKYFEDIVFTDGVKYLAESCGTFWFLDIVCSYQSNPKIKAEGFQVWTLKAKDSRGVVTCGDGNNNELIKQEIEFTDFPLDKITVWKVDNVIMLPNEY